MDPKVIEDIKKYPPLSRYYGNDGEYIYMDNNAIKTIRKEESKNYRFLWIILVIINILAFIGIFVAAPDNWSFGRFQFLVAGFTSLVVFDIICAYFISLLITLKVSQAIQIRMYAEMAKLNHILLVASNRDKKNNNKSEPEN